MRTADAVQAHARGYERTDLDRVLDLRALKTQRRLHGSLFEPDLRTKLTVRKIQIIREVSA